MLESYLKQLSEKTELHREYIFRGHGDSTWKLQSSARRRLLKHLGGGQTGFKKEYLKYIKKSLIEKGRAFGYGLDDGTKISDLDLLAKYQHLGAATCLLDFSRNFLIALSFACESVIKNDKEADGSVHIINSHEHTELYKVSPEIASKSTIDDFFSEDRVGFWEPKRDAQIAPRLLRQHSLFIIDSGEEEIKNTGTIVVRAQDKIELLKHLKDYFDIHEESLYPDIFGFCLANNVSKPITIPEIKDVEEDIGSTYRRANEYYQSGEDQKAIRLYTRLLEQDTSSLDKDHIFSFKAELYFNRGNAYSEIEKYNSAIEDYHDAKKHDYHHQDILLFNLANAYFNDHKFQEAIKYYEEISDKTPEEFRRMLPFYNCGNSYYRIDEFEKSAECFKAALKINNTVSSCYHNLGNTLVRQGHYQDAYENYEAAIKHDPNFASARRNQSSLTKIIEDSVDVGGNVHFIGNVGNYGNYGSSPVFQSGHVAGFRTGKGSSGLRSFNMFKKAKNNWEILLH